MIFAVIFGENNLYQQIKLSRRIHQLERRIEDTEKKQRKDKEYLESRQKDDFYDIEALARRQYGLKKRERWSFYSLIRLKWITKKRKSLLHNERTYSINNLYNCMLAPFDRYCWYDVCSNLLDGLACLLGGLGYSIAHLSLVASRKMPPRERNDFIAFLRLQACCGWR